MMKLISVSALAIALAASPALAGDFNPLKTAKRAVDLGLDTAHKAVDLGLETAEEAADAAEDAVTLDDNCPRGERYKGSDGNWHTCR